MYRPQPQPRNRQELILPEPQELPAIIVRRASQFARNHKYVTGAYVLGLAVLLLVGSGTALTTQQVRQYNSIMKTIDMQAEYDASYDFARANHEYRQSKGWFFTCNAQCQQNYQVMMQKRQTLEAIQAEGRARMSDAKATAGIFSEIGKSVVSAVCDFRFLSETEKCTYTEYVPILTHDVSLLLLPTRYRHRGD